MPILMDSIYEFLGFATLKFLPHILPYMVVQFMVSSGRALGKIYHLKKTKSK